MNFVEDYVVHWTHWIGRLWTQIREHVEEHGTFPERLEYGPRNRESLKKVGPSVRYQFADGRLVDLYYSDAQGTYAPVETPVEPGVESTEKEPARPGFGLKDIVELRDLTQDDQIRGPMAGIYILTGGPGVGKTSVALHRIPYLLLEQAGQLPAEVPGAPTEFFRSDTVHVVVWKEHLIAYLQECLTELQFGEVAVHHVEDWVARTLRDYVRFGQRKGQYQKELTDEPEDIRRMKMGFTDGADDRWPGLTETVLSSFLTSRENGEFHNPLANELVEDIDAQLAELRASFASTPLTPRFRDPTAQFVPTVAGIESAIQILRDDLERLAEHVAQAIEGATDTGQRMQFATIRPIVTRSREAVTNLREKLIERLSRDYPSLLSEFYRSPIVGRARHRAVWPSESGSIHRG